MDAYYSENRGMRPGGVSYTGAPGGTGSGDTDYDNAIWYINRTTSAAGAHTHSVSVNGTSAANGSGTAHENRPPYYTLIYCVKCR